MNIKVRKIIPQLITLFVVLLIFGFFTFNAQVNMDNRGIEFGFGFLSQESSFDVQFSLIDYDGSHSYARAYLVGLLNTLLVAFIGIGISTVFAGTKQFRWFRSTQLVLILLLSFVVIERLGGFVLGSGVII